MAKNGKAIKPIDLGFEGDVEREYRKGVTYVARVPLLSVPPIKTSNPALFLKMIEALKEQCPDLVIHTFKVEIT